MNTYALVSLVPVFRHKKGDAPESAHRRMIRAVSEGDFLFHQPRVGFHAGREVGRACRFCIS